MFPFQIGPGHVGYNLDRCEEIVLIDAWLKIRARINHAENWANDFEDRFFKSGGGVSEKYLENIDRHLRRLKFEALNFSESESTHYMKIRGQEKVDARRHILEDLQTRSNTDSIIEAARLECRNIPPLLERAEQVDDPALAAQRRKEEALGRARREQEAAEAEQMRLAKLAMQEAEAVRARQAELAAQEAEVERLQQAQAALDANLENARAMVAAADAALGQHLGQQKPAESRLFGALEDLLLGLPVKLDLLMARSKLANLQINDLVRRMNALDEHVSEETERTLAAIAAAQQLQDNVSPEDQDQADYESRWSADGHGPQVGNGNGHDRYGRDRHGGNGHGGNGHGGNGHSNGHDRRVIYSTPGGYTGEESR